MSRNLVLLLVLPCISFGIEHSIRIRALGTDFAYLIPDYETDLYLDPNIIGKRLIGASYDHKADIPYEIRVLTKRFGWYGQYWGEASERKSLGDNVREEWYFSANDCWMLDLRDKLPKFIASEVWNLRNDFYYIHYSRIELYPYHRKEHVLKYVMSANGSLPLSKHASLVTRVAGGIYKNYLEDTDTTRFTDKWLAVYSARLGVYYRKSPVHNRFASWYFDIGGPVSTSDIDGLPYSIFSHVSQSGDFRHTFFGKAFMAKCGWAKGIPIQNSSFIAIGIHNDFLIQYTNKADTTIDLLAINNYSSIPVALEYRLNRFAVRFGTRLICEFKHGHEWYDDTVTIYDSRVFLNVKYSFGLSWKPIERFSIDLYSREHLASLLYWAIYLKYEP